MLWIQYNIIWIKSEEKQRAPINPGLFVVLFWSYSGLILILSAGHAHAAHSGSAMIVFIFFLGQIGNHRFGG